MAKTDFLKLAGSEEMDSFAASGIITAAIAETVRVIGDIDDVLCIGVGNGAELSFFKKVKGIDINEKSISICRDMGYDVEKMDMHNMSFQDNTFSMVFSRDVFEHAVSPIEAISEMARVTRKYVVIVLPDETWQSSKWHFIIPTVKQMIFLGEKAKLQLKALREYNMMVGNTVINQSLYIFEKH